MAANSITADYFSEETVATFFLEKYEERERRRWAESFADRSGSSKTGPGPMKPRVSLSELATRTALFETSSSLADQSDVFGIPEKAYLPLEDLESVLSSESARAASLGKEEVHPAHRKVAVTSVLIVGVSLLALLSNSYGKWIPEAVIMVPLMGGLGLLSVSTINILRSLRVFD